MNASPKIPQGLSLFQYCQEAGYRVLEDMRALYHHPEIARSTGREGTRYDAFLTNVNRLAIHPDSLAGAAYSGKHDRANTFFKLTDPEGCITLAKEVLDWYDTPAAAGAIPPPIWLRFLPACLKVTQNLGLVSDALPRLRWIAFNVELPQWQRKEQRVVNTANINSNRCYPCYDQDGKIELKTVRTASGQKQYVHGLSDVLFDLSSAIAQPTINAQPTSDGFPHVCWGIRLRTKALGGRDSKPFSPWIGLDLNQPTGGDLPTSIHNWHVPDFDQRFASESEPYVRALVHHWLFWADPDVRPENIKNTPSRQLRGYCETLQAFFPEGRWPDSVDFLLCPGVFWSLDPKTQGTAATIFWGFEGALGDDTANAVLAISQSLLAGITQFARAADVQASAEVQGSVRENISHELRPVQRVLSPRFAFPPNRFFEVSPRKRGPVRKDGKLGTITVAKSADDAFADMAIIPFRPAFDAGAMQLGLWLQTGWLVDLPPDIAQANTWKSVTTACWRQAARVIAVCTLGNEYPGSLQKLKDYRTSFDDIVQQFAPHITCRDPVALWPLVRTNDQAVCGMCRVLVALYLNVCIHGDSAQKVTTALSRPSDLWIDLSVGNARPTDDSATRGPQLTSAVSKAVKSLGRVGGGCWHTRNVVDAIMQSLGGPPAQWPSEGAAADTPFVVTCSFPVPKGT